MANKTADAEAGSVCSLTRTTETRLRSQHEDLMDNDRKDHQTECGEDCRYRKLYEGTQATLTDMATKQALALSRHGRMRSGVTNAVRNAFPRQFNEVETAIGTRLIDIDDESLLAYVAYIFEIAQAQGIVQPAREGAFNDLADALEEIGVPIPPGDDPSVWAQGIRSWWRRGKLPHLNKQGRPKTLADALRWSSTGWDENDLSAKMPTWAGKVDESMTRPKSLAEAARMSGQEKTEQAEQPVVASNWGNATAVPVAKPSKDSETTDVVVPAATLRPPEPPVEEPSEVDPAWQKVLEPETEVDPFSGGEAKVVAIVRGDTKKTAEADPFADDDETGATGDDVAAVEPDRTDDEAGGQTDNDQTEADSFDEEDPFEGAGDLGDIFGDDDGGLADIFEDDLGEAVGDDKDDFGSFDDFDDVVWEEPEPADEAGSLTEEPTVDANADKTPVEQPDQTAEAGAEKPDNSVEAVKVAPIAPEPKSGESKQAETPEESEAGAQAWSVAETSPQTEGWRPVGGARATGAAGKRTLNDAQQNAAPKEPVAGNKTASEAAVTNNASKTKGAGVAKAVATPAAADAPALKPTKMAPGGALRPELFPAAPKVARKRATRRTRRTLAAPPETGNFDVAPSELVNGEVTDELKNKIEAACCIPRPMFTSDLDSIFGEDAVMAWQEACRDNNALGVRFVPPKARHRARGALVLPVGQLRKASLEFGRSWWGTCLDQYRGAKLYELAVLLHQVGDQIATPKFGTETAMLRLNQTRGLVGVVVAIGESLQEDGSTRAQIRADLQELFADKLELIAVLTTNANNLDEMVTACLDDAQKEGWTPNCPVVSAKSWDWADNNTSTYIHVLG